MALAVCLLVLAVGGWAWWRHRGVAPSERARLEQQLLDAVARQPGSAAAHRELGRFYLRSQQPFEALWELEQARVLESGSQATAVEVSTALAMAHLYGPAAAVLQETVAATPGSRVGRQQLAALYLATARPDQALALLRTAPDLGDWPEGQLLLGRCDEGLGQISPALRAYERCAQLAPGSSEGAFREARLLLTSGKPQAARDLLTAARTRAPRDPRLVVLLAMTYSARWSGADDVDRQGALLSEALQLAASQSVPARLAMGALYVRHRRFQEGGRLLMPLAEREDVAAAHRGVAAALVGLGQPVEAHYHRGMAAVLEGQADRALPEFRALAAGAPDDARAPQLISQTYAEMNRLNESLHAARALYDRGDRSPDLFERLATLSLLTHDRRAARRIGEEWRRVQPDSGRPAAHLGKVALQDLRLADAVRFYEEAVAKEPKNAQHLLGLADALGHQPSPENARRALSLLRQAVVLAPRDARAHYQLGVSLQQSGQTGEARTEFLRALDEDPSQAASYNNLVQVAAAMRLPVLVRRFESLMHAVQEDQRANKAAWQRRWEHPTDPQAYTDLALLLARSGAMGSAEQQLQRALELHPGGAPASQLLARCRRLLDGMDPDGRRLAEAMDVRALEAKDEIHRRGAETAEKG